MDLYTLVYDAVRVLFFDGLLFRFTQVGKLSHNQCHSA